MEGDGGGEEEEVVNVNSGFGVGKLVWCCVAAWRHGGYSHDVKDVQSKIRFCRRLGLWRN